MTTHRRPTPQELLEGAIQTIEHTLTPELGSIWARSSALGLLGQLRYALTRLDGDSLSKQDTELERCLSALFNAYPELREAATAGARRGESSWDLREQAGRLLVFALDRESEAAEAIRERLRPLLIAHASEDLAESGPMLQAFLASGSLGSTG